MKILLPISLDRWKNPISTLLRACVEFNPEIEFHSFSNPVTQEDRDMGTQFWKLPNLSLRHPSAVFSDSFDIVHTASYSRFNWYSSVIAKLRTSGSTKFLTTLNLEPDLSLPVERMRYGRLLRFADAFVAVSEAVSADVRRRNPERFLEVIPNGFDAKLYNPDLIDDTVLPPEIARLAPGFPLWVSAVESRKQPETFLKLARSNPDVPFVALGSVLPGDGEVYAEMFRSTPNIIWPGSVPRAVTRAIMAKAGALVFPSEREGLSLAMIEAIALGLPILAQPKSSMPELVRPGFNGELIDVNHFEEWNHALHRWSPIRTAEQEQNLQSARHDALQKYAWDVVGRRYQSIYEKVLTMKTKKYYPLQWD
jgi:glycosyltransferase involved in cell wall biosynthesis